MAVNIGFTKYNQVLITTSTHDFITLHLPLHTHRSLKETRSILWRSMYKCNVANAATYHQNSIMEDYPPDVSKGILAREYTLFVVTTYRKD